MFHTLFGWKRANKCKKLIKKLQCRLKILKNKRCAIANQLREDVAQLLKDTHQHTALNRLEQLYKDEHVVSVYDMLDKYSEFIILHLSYIRRCKDLPNDINEAISTLIYASARCGDLPELCLLRKLFEERYGHRFSTMALEFLPGNLVCLQVKDKLTPKPATEIAKNKLLHEIVKDYFFKPGTLSLEYPPEFHAQPPKITKLSEVDEVSISTNCSIVKQLSSPMAEIPKGQIVERASEEREKGGYSSDSSTQYPDESSVVYVDDVEEFKSGTNEGVLSVDDQDQRYFVFKSGLIKKTKGDSHSNRDENKKEIVVYNVFREEIEDMGMMNSQIMEMEVWSKGIYGKNSPSHVHPKLPDYDQIEAKFKELKKIYQLNNV